MTIVVRKETATAAAAILDLLKAVTAGRPELLAAVAHGARVSFDTVERSFLIGAVQADGTSVPFLAVPADPSDPEAFGAAGVPMAMPGLHGGPPPIAH